MANQLGYVHVDDLLNDMSPEEFDERVAHYRNSGVGDARRIVGLVASEVHNLFLRYAQAKTGKHAPLSDEFDFMGSFAPERVKKPGTIDINKPEAADALAKAWGFEVGE